MKKAFGALALGLALLGGTSAKAATFTVNDFETDLSGFPSNPGSAVAPTGAIGTFGVTSGTQALSYANTFHSPGANSNTLIDSGSLNTGPAGGAGQETLEQQREYQAINAASIASATAPVQFIFDVTYDASNLPSDGSKTGFFQFGPQINSDAGAGANTGGFQNGLTFGGLLNFNMGPGGTNPGLAPAALAAGDSIIDLQLAKTGTASNSTIGQLEVVVNVSHNANPGTLHLISGGTSFADLGFGYNGTFGATLDPTTFTFSFINTSFGIDNVRFVTVPEPATLGLMGLLVPALAMRRRKA